MSEARRHHYVPQFYLRRFADQKERLRMLRRSTGKVVTTSVTNAAVKTGFYDIETEQGIPRDLVEKTLSSVEGEVAKVLGVIDGGGWPLSDDDRATLALFMGLQIVRTPEHRFMFEEMADVQAKFTLAGITREEIRDILIADGEDASDENIDEHLEAIRDFDDYRVTIGQGFMWGTLLGDTAPRLARVMLEVFDWHLMVSDKRMLATSDNPLLLWVEQPNRFIGVGIGTADAIVFPLDSRKLLLLTRDRSGVSLQFDLTRVMAKGTNGYLLGRSKEWVFHDPRLAPFDPKDLTPTTRGSFMVNNEEVREPGDAWRHVSDLFFTTRGACFGESGEEE